MHGAWRIADSEQPANKLYGEHAYYFSPHGELILSMRRPAGVERAVLTWAKRGELVVVDQPSAPREDAVRWLLASEHTLQLGDSWYVREQPGDAFDAEAPWWALVAGASWYGIENAGPEPFVPFLLLETGDQRQLRRIVTQTAPEAETAADELVRGETYERGAWVRDGRIWREQPGVPKHEVDAILVTRMEPGGTRGTTHALAYELAGERARITGGIQTI